MTVAEANNIGFGSYKEDKSQDSAIAVDSDETSSKPSQENERPLLNPIVGKWRYGSISKPMEYQITETKDGQLHFQQSVEQLRTSQGGGGITMRQQQSLADGQAFGLLRRQGALLHADVASNDGERICSIRLSFRKKDIALVSNLKTVSKWGKDIVARRVADECLQEQIVQDSTTSSLGDVGGVRRHRGLLSVPPQAAASICEFAEIMKDSKEVASISGGRCEVFLAGDRSEAFVDFASQHTHSDALLPFLADLESKLSEVADKGGGKLAKDIVALVGGDEMQVPHVDLQPGQIQIIVALARTTPTLVYDRTAEGMGAKKVMKTIGVDMKHAKDVFLSPLFHGGFPLVLPVSSVFASMVPACDDFSAGDFLEMADGIVHAGPCCHLMAPLRRVVIFATYQTAETDQYDVGFQYSLWDWAFHEEVPAMLAYRRLREVYEFSCDREMSIKPWTHYNRYRKSACHKLCTDPALDEGMVKALVQMWRTGKQPKNMDFSGLRPVRSDESDTDEDDGGSSAASEGAGDTGSVPSDTSSSSTPLSSSIQQEENALPLEE